MIGIYSEHGLGLCLNQCFFYYSNSIEMNPSASYVCKFRKQIRSFHTLIESAEHVLQMDFVE